MKKFAFVFAVSAVMAASTAARADGFNCQTVDGDLNIKVYNHTDAADGTRSSAVMVLSDPAVGAGRKTIAKFTDSNETLTNVGASYETRVDLRFNDSGRKGELIAGTKIGYLKTISVDVAFSYNQPVSHGTELEGTLTLVKRDGSEITRDLVCKRYLKN
jgi:hypothetical protein